MKRYFLGLIFLLSSFSFARPITLQEAIDLLNDPTTTTLDLDLAGKRIGSEEVQALANAIQENSTITTLDLNLVGNLIRGEGAQALASAIQENSTITNFYLHLGFNEIGNEGAQALANVIQENSTITALYLDLKHNEISNEGVQALAGAIQGNSTITAFNLNLVGNLIRGEGAQALANVIQENSTITNFYLDLGSNEIGSEGVQALAGAIQGNSTITTLNLRLTSNRISDEMEENITNTIKNVLNRNRRFAKFVKGFLELFNSETLTDCLVRSIPAHSTILKARLGTEILNKLNENLKTYKKQKVKAFLAWIYTGLAKSSDLESIKKICENLGINFEEKNKIAGFKRDMQNLYNSREETGDFTIIVDEEGIPAHKTVLAARSGFFRNMFQTVTEDESNKVTYPTNLNSKLFQQFLEYVYTAREPVLETEDNKEDWNELIEFYQVGD